MKKIFLSNLAVLGTVAMPIVTVISCGEESGFSIEYVKSAEYHFLNMIFSNKTLNNSIGDKDISLVDSGDFINYVENHRIFNLLPGNSKKHLLEGIQNVEVINGKINLEYDDFIFEYQFEERFDYEDLYTIDEVNKIIDVDVSGLTTYEEFIDVLIDIWCLDTWTNLELENSKNNLYMQAIGSSYNPDGAFNSEFIYTLEEYDSVDYTYSINWVNGDENYVFNANAFTKVWDGDETTSITDWLITEGAGWKDYPAFSSEMSGSLKDTLTFEIYWEYLSGRYWNFKENNIDWSEGHVKRSSLEAGDNWTLLKWWRIFSKSDFLKNIVSDDTFELFDWNWKSLFRKNNRITFDAEAGDKEGYNSPSHAIYDEKLWDTYGLSQGEASNLDMLLLHKLTNLYYLNENAIEVKPEDYVDELELKIVAVPNEDGTTKAGVKSFEKSVDDKLIFSEHTSFIPGNIEGGEVIAIGFPMDVKYPYYVDNKQRPQYNWESDGEINVLYNIATREIVGAPTQILNVDDIFPGSISFKHNWREVVVVSETPTPFPRDIDNFDIRPEFQSTKIDPNFSNTSSNLEWYGDSYDIDVAYKEEYDFIARDFSLELEIDLSDESSYFYTAQENNVSSKIKVKAIFTLIIDSSSLTYHIHKLQHKNWSDIIIEWM